MTVCGAKWSKGNCRCVLLEDHAGPHGCFCGWKWIADPAPSETTTQHRPDPERDAAYVRAIADELWIGTVVASLRCGWDFNDLRGSYIEAILRDRLPHLPGR